MRTKSILVRLQNTLEQQNLDEQILLVAEPTCPGSVRVPDHSTINLVVGYTGSYNSQTALDLALWIAHQTRLATSKQVTVHVVYVVDTSEASSTIGKWRMRSDRSKEMVRDRSSRRAQAATKRANRANSAVLSQPLPTMLTPDQLEDVDQILWKARCLADEWRGSLNIYLRFGTPADELREVAFSEEADLLVLGCHNAEHPLVQKLATNVPCPVLGIPETL